MRRTVMTLVAALALIAPLGAPVATAGHASGSASRKASGSLKVSVTEVPRGTKASVRVVGISGRAMGIRRTVHLRDRKKLRLIRGAYRVTPNPVIREGRKYWTVPARRVVTVRPGRTARAQFRYRTPAGPLSFTDISAGSDFSCGVTTDTRVHCWGSNEAAQLGSGSTVVRSTTPIAISSPSSGWTSVDAAGPCGVRGDGIWCWGSWKADPRGAGDTLPSRYGPGQVGTSLDGTCAVYPAPQPSIGCVLPFGYFDQNNGDIGSPVPLLTAAGTYKAGCGLDGSGRPWCWRHPDTSDRSPAVAVATTVTFRQLSVASKSACGVSDTGEIWCWQIGETTPARVEPSRPYTTVSVDARPDTACALDVEGRAWCWGDLPGAETVPTLVRGDLRFTDISVGWNHACALAGTRAWCWGANGSGQLGDGTTTERLSPTAVAGPY